ncbi:MAG: recombinase family protein [Olsenella sp.]|nr:recombinase family protein [Olsenella sp.]
MRYGYARVSSRGQAVDGSSLESQRRQLEANGCDQVVEECFTGTKRHRPQLDALLDRLVEGDELYVCKLDRIARSLQAGLDLFEEMDRRGVRVTVLNMGTMSGDPASRLMRNVMLAVAEFERDMIYERTREGLERAHEQGRREGRPRKAIDSTEFGRHRTLVESKEETVNEACAALGIGRTKWYELLREAA